MLFLSYLGFEVDVKCDAGYRGSGQTRCTVCTVRNTFRDSSNQGYVRNRLSDQKRWYFVFQDGIYGQPKDNTQVATEHMSIKIGVLTLSVGEKYKIGSGSNKGKITGSDSVCDERFTRRRRGRERCVRVCRASTDHSSVVS